MEIAKAPLQYQQIYKCLQMYHGSDLHKTRLIDDMTHDLWINLHTKATNFTYIRKTCKHYPKDALRRYTNQRDYAHREVVIMNSEGEYMEFPVSDPEFELPVVTITPKLRDSRGRQARKILVKYLNGEREEVESVRVLAHQLGVGKSFIKYIYDKIKDPKVGMRGTMSKMAHIKTIEFI